MKPGTSSTSWLWIPAPLFTGQSYLSSTSVTDPGAVPSHQGWGPSQATSFSSTADAQTYVACFSTPNTSMLQFLYQHTSSAAFLLSTNRSIKSRQVYCCVLLNVGHSAGAILNSSWLLRPCFSSEERNAALLFWCSKGLHRPFSEESLRDPCRRQCRPL